ncbi:LOW QUALITY PROTEIN: hypothetical protein ACHAW5_000274 [Stephanodiscus triporus]|uniref:Uncharacterized protein n=1 Tax=Stephanodiscus triporus TaxID=2934178 RepID=A0ABD3MMY5_9STRA
MSSSVFVYGCSDGAMRFHDLGGGGGGGRASTTVRNGMGGNGGGGRQSTIKSVRGPNGRNDPVVTILDVDPAYDDDDDNDDDEYSRSVSDDRTLAMRSRILTACGSGVAFLWEVRVAIDRSSGTLRDLTVMPCGGRPLVRLDGLGNLTTSPRDAPGAPAPSSSSSNPGPRTRPPPGGFWGMAADARSRGGGASADAPYMTATPAISHDPHRNLLTWTLPPDAPASSIDHGDDCTTSAGDRDDRASLVKWAAGNGGFVKVWDMSSIVGGDRRSAAQHAHHSSPRPPPKVPPIAIARLPSSAASSAASSIAGLSHAAAPAASLTCVSLSRDGSRVLVHSAPLPDAVDGADDGQDGGGQSSSVSPVQSKRKKVGADGAKPSILHVNFTLLRAVPLAGFASSPSLIGTAVFASHLVPDVLTVATDRGVVHVNLDDGKTSPYSGDEFKMRSACSAVPAGPVHAVISLGGVGNRPGILFVEDRVVFTSRLRATVSSNDPKPVLIKKVDVHDKTMVCKLQGRNPPWRMVRSTRTSTFVESLRPMKSQPRLIPSPSGRYLCLFWERERNYEILHAGSLLAREQTNNPGSATASDGRGHRVTPFVDSGTNVSSFAWVGDDDNFAILRQLNTLPIVLDGNDGDLSGSSNPNPFPSSVKQCRPKVELFKLAEVKIDAVELVAGASVAAATIVSLGSLTVRGGDRVIPSVLFGGPSLCVCCLSTSDRADMNIGDNVAYFYSRKGGAIEKNDERANTYFSIGTSIPYPDLVTWDEHGTLCAISYGYRVAVYLSDESRFILLGSVRVANSSDVELPLLSMKFIHGVLYCSTQLSVHAIFLGNIEDNDTVCEIDAFTIATDCVPLYGMDNPDISSPAPIIAALTQPHVLAYHSGGLLVSTLTGLRLLSLSHPIVRIGTLLAANLIDRARKWIVAMPQVEHDGLAHFLIRRGHVDLAISELNGLSLETYIDLCMRFERTDELVYLLGKRGSEVIPETCDWGRDYGKSAFLSIGVYMLGKGKIECAKKMIAQAAEAGLCELLVDAMKLATFVSVVDQPEGSALIQKVTDAMDFNINRQFALVNIL